MRRAQLLQKTSSSIAAPWRASLGLLREHREQLSVLGVTPAHARILLYLQQHPHSYIHQCARAFGLTWKSIGYSVRILEQRRLLMKRRAPQDERCLLLTLRPKGTDLARAIRQQLDSTLGEKTRA